MQTLASEFQEDKIDLILLNSPHGYTHLNDYLIYFHNIYEGWHFLEKEEGMSVEQLVWSGNTKMAELLLQTLNSAGFSSSPLLLGDPNYPLKLSWGDTIPLSFVATNEGPQVVIFSHPMNIGAEERDSQGEMLKMGEVLENFLNAPGFEEINFSLIISGDLSHRHDPEHQYGFHTSAGTFDKLVIDWVANPNKKMYGELVELHQTAESCGIYGIGILQGIFDATSDTWKSVICEYELPSYFGMAVASWKR